MAGRMRRVRLLVLLVLGAVAFVLFTRSTSPVDSYREYYKQNPIGGGAVIRPPGELDYAETPVGPAPAPESSSTPAPTHVYSSTSTTVEKARQTSTTTTTDASSSNSYFAAETPAPVVPPPHPAEHADFPYQVGEGRVEVSLIPLPTHVVEHWKKQPEHFPVSNTIQLPTGTSIPLPRIQRNVNKLSIKGADKERMAIVKAAAEHSWKGYKDFAWGMDEVRPISGKLNNPFNAWGATLVDSLDTLWLMGMVPEFEDAVEAVKNIDFTTTPRADIPVFETTIRYLGGLIAAYDVSEKKYIALLDKAVELAEVLFSIFDTPNRMPQTFFRWKPVFASQPHRSGNRVILAEIGTLSLEFTRLAQLTGEPKYYDAIARITDEFEKWQNNTRVPGLWPMSLDASGCGKLVAQPEQILHPDGSDRRVVAGNPVKTGEKRLPADTAADKPSLTNRKRQLEHFSANKALTKDENDPSASDKRQLQQLSMSSADTCIKQGLASTSKNTQETFTLSGGSDSMYEYLPKEYILLGGQIDQYRTMYLDSAQAFIEKLLFKPMTKDGRDILLTGEVKLMPNYSQPAEEREYIEIYKAEAAHLACFAGGMFAMGGVLFEKPEHVAIASKLTDGCVWAYNVTQTGIMPEAAEVIACEDTWGDCAWNETQWRRALDPHMESRLKVYPGSARYSDSRAHHAAKDRPAPDVPQAPRPESLPNSQPKNDLREKAEDFYSLKHKRQLQGGELPRPQAEDRGLENSKGGLAAAAETIYEPEQPLSHEEYVNKKIEEERMPPGFTRINSRKYILRPEAIESVFYMYRITGEQYWRDVGWDMFTSIMKYTKAPHGHSAIDDITRAAPNMADQMESFWIAETLKYFYLLYDDPDTWSLDDWVLNTEAHLFKRPSYEFKPVDV